jgi:paraquat-inducible protein A
VRWLRARTALHRLIDFVGRWSNIDVFMVSILVASLQFGTLTTVAPGPGIVSFAAVVVLTMLATAVFDPRLMWDAASGGDG